MCHCTEKRTVISPFLLSFPLPVWINDRLAERTMKLVGNFLNVQLKIVDLHKNEKLRINLMYHELLAYMRFFIYFFRRRELG